LFVQHVAPAVPQGAPSGSVPPSFPRLLSTLPSSPPPPPSEVVAVDDPPPQAAIQSATNEARDA
jgi:hypothetical protein